MNKIEKRYFALSCLWRHFCPNFIPTKGKLKRIHPSLKKLICMKRACNMRDNSKE